MPSDKNLSYKGFINRKKPKTAAGKENRHTNTLDKTRFIGELYKRMMDWRMMGESQRVAELVEMLSLPESTLKASVSY